MFTLYGMYVCVYVLVGISELLYVVSLVSNPGFVPGRAAMTYAYNVKVMETGYAANHLR